MFTLFAACGTPKPTPVVSTTPRWQEVEALAEVDCDEWPEDEFPTDVAPKARREALRAWHAADPGANVDVDARYATFSYVDHTEPADVEVIAHLVGSLRACGRWVDARHEEELVLRACAADPSATARAIRALPPPPSPTVRAAREAVWIVEMEAPSVSGRFTASLLAGTKEWMARWVLDGEGALPEMPANMPFGQLLREETRAPQPGVPEQVARCTTGAPDGSFRVPSPAAAGVLRAGPDGAPTVWWPADGVLGTEGPLGPLEWWADGERRGAVVVGALRRVEDCPGRPRWEASASLGDRPPPAPGSFGILLPPGVPLAHRLEADACGLGLAGPEGTWSLGCCAP